MKMPKSNKVKVIKNPKYAGSAFSLENGAVYLYHIYPSFFGSAIFIDIENTDRSRKMRIRVSKSIYQSMAADELNMIIFRNAKKLDAQYNNEQPEQIKFIQFLIPLKYREEISGDLSEMIHEMKAEGMKKWAITVVIYWQLLYIGYAALFFKLKEITGKASEGAKEKKKVSK